VRFFYFIHKQIPDDAPFRTIQDGLADYILERDTEKHKGELGTPFFGLRFCQNTEAGAGDGMGTPLWLCPECYPSGASDIWTGDPLDKGIPTGTEAGCTRKVVVKLSASDSSVESRYGFTLPEHDRLEGQGQQIASLPLNRVLGISNPGNPAYNAGIRASDVILEVNGTKALGMSRQQILAAIETSAELGEITFTLGRKSKRWNNRTTESGAEKGGSDGGSSGGGSGRTAKASK
jgi:hypothetical protein